jgi:phosphoinositide-3-kinase regulatory subunit 4
VHPSADVRYFAISTVNSVCLALGHPDGEVFVVPILRPFLRFQPSLRHLTTREGLEMCLHAPWTRDRFQAELSKLLADHNPSLSPTSDQWTSIAFQTREGEDDTQSSESPANKAGKEGESPKVNKPDLQTEQVRTYLQMLARSRTYYLKVGSEGAHSRAQLNRVIEGSMKLSQQIKFPRQNRAGQPAAILPSWYSTLREAQGTQEGRVSESAAIRSVSTLGQVYGLSIMDQNAATTSLSAEMTSEHAADILQSEESHTIEAACTGEWGSETCLDPTLTDTSLLVTKLNALQVPPLPPRLAEERGPVQRVIPPPTRTQAKEGAGSSSEWKPKIDTMVASSRCSPGLGHTAPIVRLVVSHDQRFFVTGSHDGTCRAWELEKAEKCNGILESSITYAGHVADGGQGSPRVNDLSMVEGSHSVVSGASDGSVHVWRVDMVSSSTKQSSPSETREVSRVAGSSEIRKVNPEEGEILAVNHFNTSAASILTYATQKGHIHSWDLRCANEPFLLKIPQDTGYITSTAMGSDRNWIVTGTSRGFIALWDLRFQQILKLWHHSRSAPVNRLATSFVPPPQSWVGRGGANSESRPFLFAACGPNECAMFDITDGSCRECFRTVDYASRFSNARLDEMPRLQEVPLPTSTRRKVLASHGLSSRLGDVVSSSFRSVNAMVGSIGASDHSFLITGGSDCRIRYWDFSVPSKCYVSSGIESVQPRPSFERIDYDPSCRLMLCRQPPTPSLSEVESSRVPRKLFQGLRKPENCHQDSIQDLKVVKSGLLSCSRDCTVKLWR